jgi:hypothetical protein
MFLFNEAGKLKKDSITDYNTDVSRITKKWLLNDGKILTRNHIEWII